jgi:hypothetical protein
MPVQFPNTFPGAGDCALPSYDALQIPSPAVVSSHSRITQLVRDPPPVDTSFTYHPERPFLPRTNNLQKRLESEGGRITELYRNPRIQPS